MDLFEAAFRFQESVLVRSIDPDHGLLRELQSRGVLTEEQINDCKSQVCHY